MTGDTCPECGQQLPPQDDCICGHSRSSHNVTNGRKKTECSRFGPRGKCPCQAYRPLEVPSVGQP